MNCPPGSWVLGVSGHGGDGVTPQTRVPSALVGEAQVMGSTGGVYLTHHWHLGDPGVAGLVQSYSGGGQGGGSGRGGTWKALGVRAWLTWVRGARMRGPARARGRRATQVGCAHRTGLCR